MPVTHKSLRNTLPPGSVQQRSYVGTIGAPCDVLTAVNGQPISDRTTFTLPSGALLRMSSDGAWIYRSFAADSLCRTRIDSFAYTLQTPSGPVDGTITLDLFPMASTSMSLERETGWLCPDSGHGASSTESLHLRYRIFTGSEATLELRSQKRASTREHETESQQADLAVIPLEVSEDLNVRVMNDGRLHIRPRPGFTGTATLQTLIESETGCSEWLTVDVEVAATCGYTDTRQNHHLNSGHAAPRTEGTTQRVFLNTSSPTVHGRSRPHAQIIGRLTSGDTEVCAQTTADAAGNWTTEFRGAVTGREHAMFFRYASGQNLYGDLTIAPPANSGYRVV